MFGIFKVVSNALESKEQFAEGGNVPVFVELSRFHRNIMGKLYFDLKLKMMRKPQEFIVYPISSGDTHIIIQSDTRIGRINMATGIGLMSQSHSSGAYSIHLVADKLIPFKLSDEQLVLLKEELSKTAGKNVGFSFVKSDNEGADKFAKGGSVDTLEKELRRLQRELNSSRLSTYFEGDTSGEEMARQKERSIKLARFNEVLALLRERDSKKYAKGGEMKDKQSFDTPILYHEKRGNLFIGKNTVYLWLYENSDAIEKLNNGEYDAVLFPPSTMSMAFSKGFVPPLKLVWTKKFQKKTKGSENLIGIIEGYIDEEKNKLYIEMMTTNPKKRGIGVMSYMIKHLREQFNLSQDDIVFVNTTKEGKKFEESKHYESGGGLENIKKQISELESKRSNWIGASKTKANRVSPYDAKIQKLQNELARERDKQTEYYTFESASDYYGKSTEEKAANMFYYFSQKKGNLSLSKFINSLKTPSQKEAFRKLKFPSYQKTWRIKMITSKAKDSISFKKIFSEGGQMQSSNPEITFERIYDERGIENKPSKYSVNYFISLGENEWIELTGTLKPYHTGRDYEYEFDVNYFADETEEKYYDEHSEEIESQILNKFYEIKNSIK